MTTRQENRARSTLSTPKGAAIAGIVFSLLLSASIVLLRLANPSETGELTASRTWAQGLGLVPLSGVAFLWFLGVLRDRIGAYEDRFFATIMLGSGLLFLAMLFTAAAVTGGLAASTEIIPLPLILLCMQITFSIMNIYVMKMAAVFMISTSTILLRTAVLPRWLTYAGYTFALVQVIMLSHWEWIVLLFPLWVLLLSTTILMTNRRASRA